MEEKEDTNALEQLVFDSLQNEQSKEKASVSLAKCFLPYVKDAFVKDFTILIQDTTICERIDACNDKDKLLSAVLESDINIIVNHVNGTDTDKKFCIDYFIDINDKRIG